MKKARTRSPKRVRRGAPLTTPDIPLPTEEGELGGMDTMAIIKLAYFAGAQQTYPLLFQSNEMTRQFESAIGDLMDSVREQARPTVIKDVFNTVRDFMLHHMEKLHRATTSDPETMAELESMLVTAPIVTVQRFVHGCYDAVLEAIQAYGQGTSFRDPSPSLCQCRGHQEWDRTAAPARRSDA